MYTFFVTATAIAEEISAALSTITPKERYCYTCEDEVTNDKETVRVRIAIKAVVTHKKGSKQYHESDDIDEHIVDPIVYEKLLTNARVFVADMGSHIHRPCTVSP